MATSGVLEFYIICYNNNFCVEYQINTINFFCKDPFKIIILDSNCGAYPKNSEDKKTICQKYGIEYIVMPNHLANVNNMSSPSFILGMKLNWTYENVIMKRNPTYFAFLDQDFFMIRPFSIIKHLDKWGMWGDLMEPDNGRSGTFKRDKIKPDTPWVLHPWLSFYALDFIKPYKMDWLPTPQFDTGGKNWNNFISRANLNKTNYWFRDNIIMYYPFAAHSTAGDPPYQQHYCDCTSGKFYGQIQINNGFMHLLNSHILTDPLHPKTAVCKGMLDGILLANGFAFNVANGHEIFDSPCNKLVEPLLEV
jgi:hypothetical protein